MLVGSDSTDDYASLVALAVEGDRDALERLFSQHRDQLKRMLTLRMDRRLQGRVDESDVIQDTFVDVNRRIGEFPSAQMSFIVWLRKLACQRLVDLQRHHLGAQQRDATREVSIFRGQFPAATSAALAARLVGRVSTPSKALMRSELKLLVEQALNSLEEIDREVLAMRHFEGLGNREVAEILGIGQNAASNRYVRALQRLKQVLDDQEFVLESWAEGL